MNWYSGSERDGGAEDMEVCGLGTWIVVACGSELLAVVTCGWKTLAVDCGCRIHVHVVHVAVDDKVVVACG